MKNGKAYVILDRPCLVAVDINGDMSDHDTTRTPGGGWYTGPPLHGISIFANPVIADKPSPRNPAVCVVKPGEKPPADGDWKTLHFLPGVHDVGLAYPLQAGRSYYIPGDALVYGSLHKEKGGHDIRIFGCGTLSGDRLESPEFALKLTMEQAQAYCPILIYGCLNSRVEGITLANAAYWSCVLGVSPDWVNVNRPALVHWVKVLGWRYNSDGFGTQYNSVIEDCFTRTNDDAIYAAA